MKKNILKASSGFTIVEIMVALGLLGAVSLGVMKIMENANKASKSIEVKDDIIQMERLITDVLSTSNNCEASLGEKTVNSDVPIIYQVINGQPVPKFSISSAATKTLQISSMKIKDIDFNGTSDGSTALATLQVQFKKPSSTLGGSQITKDIMINANLCQKKWIQNAVLKDLMTQCNGKIVEGPNKWGTTYWAACQDCTMASSKTIYSCQARGGSGGVDLGNMSKINCYNLGGTFNDTTSSCDIKDTVTKDSCYALGGRINPTTEACEFDGKNLLDYIKDVAKKELPQCVVLPACTTSYPNKKGAYVVQNEPDPNHNFYTIKCTAGYKRYWWTGGWFNQPNAKSLLCASNYSKYGSTTYSCTTAKTENPNLTCSLPQWILGCSGCGSGCFEKNTADSCQIISTEPIITSGKLYNCCR